MKLATHARESQATSLCHRNKVWKSLWRLPYLAIITSVYRCHNTRKIWQESLNLSCFFQKKIFKVCKF